MSERRKNILNFENEYCSFKPYDWITIEGVSRPVIFKVVKNENNKSLGLRHNPNIMTFPQGQWVVLDDNLIVPGEGDWGGIWAARTKGTANEIKKYMIETRGEETKIFLTVIDRPVFINKQKDRVKSGGVMLLEEIKQ